LADAVVLALKSGDMVAAQAAAKALEAFVEALSSYDSSHKFRSLTTDLLSNLDNGSTPQKPGRQGVLVVSILFISHSKGDNAAAEALRDQLFKAGYHTLFLDIDPVHGFRSGTRWEPALYSHLRAASRVIVIWSERALNSRWVFAEAAIARSLGKPVTTVVLTGPQDPSSEHAQSPGAVVPDILCDRQVIPVDSETLDFSRLIGNLSAIGERPRGAAMLPNDPFPGLFPYEEANAGVFFGRDEDVDNISRIVSQTLTQGLTGLVLLLGASGCGKSSLLRAGVAPRLAWESNFLLVGPFRPSSHPMDNLVAALRKTFVGVTSPLVWTELGNALRTASAGSLDNVFSWFYSLKDLSENQGRTVVVLIDQLEDLAFDKPTSSPGGAEDESFLRLVGALACRTALERDFVVVASLRSDFLDTFQIAFDRAAAMKSPPRGQPFYVRPLPPEGLKDAIQKPALLMGGRFEEGLVDDLMRDAEVEHGLPLLAFALETLWKTKDADGTVHRESYNRVGLVHLLVDAADTIFASAVAAHLERSLQTALLHMVRSVDGRRIRRPILERDHWAVRDYLERFVRARLLVARTETDGFNTVRVFELVHDVLFEAWGTLKRALDQYDDFIRWHSSLEDLMKRDNPLGNLRPEEALRGKQLDVALHWVDQEGDRLLSREREFVDAAERHRQRDARRKRAKRTALMLGAFCVVTAFALMVSLFWQKERRAAAAAEKARLQAVQSQGVAEDNERKEEQAVWQARTQLLAATQTVPIALQGVPQAVVCDGQYVWVALVRLDTATGRPQKVDSHGIGRTNLFRKQVPKSTLARFKPSQPSTIEYFDVGPIDDMVTVDGALWTLDRQGGSLTRFAGLQPQHIALGDNALGLVAEAGTVLVAHEKASSQFSFWTFDAKTGHSLGAPPPTRSAPEKEKGLFASLLIERAGQSLWAASSMHATLTSEHGKTIELGANLGASDLAWDGEHLWVARNASTVLKVTESGQVGSVDAGVPVESVFFDGRTTWLLSTDHSRLVAYDQFSPVPRMVSLPAVEASEALVKREDAGFTVQTEVLLNWGKSVGWAKHRRLASDGTYLYSIRPGDRLYRIPALSFAVGGKPSSLMTTREHIWVASRSFNELRRYDYAGRFVDRHPFTDPTGMAHFETLIWVASATNKSVSQLNERGEAVRVFPIPGSPGELVATAKSAWALDLKRAVVYEIPTDGSEATEMSLLGRGERTTAIGWDGHKVWVLLKHVGEDSGRNLVAIDPASHRVVETYSLGNLAKTALDTASPRPPAGNAPIGSKVATAHPPATASAQKLELNLNDGLTFDARSGRLCILVQGYNIACITTRVSPPLQATSPPSSLYLPGMRGSDHPFGVQAAGRAIWVSDSRGNTVTPFLFGTAPGDQNKLLVGSPILLATNDPYERGGDLLQGGPRVEQGYSSLAEGRGDLWVITGRSEGVMRVMLSSVGSPVLPPGACTMDGETPANFVMSWNSPVDASPQQSEKGMRLSVRNQYEVIAQDHGKVRIDVEYVGTESVRSVDILLMDSKDRVLASSGVSLLNCGNRSAVALGVDSPGGNSHADLPPVSAIEFRPTPVIPGERGTLRIWGLAQVPASP
jgi:hypothetical protein